ncbi:hypothetical protein PENTCL1PPCAC_27733, partial [Pristionchus entomophagus]
CLYSQPEKRSESGSCVVSLDRTNSNVGSAGIQCCHCLKLLTKKEGFRGLLGKYPKCSFLKCGHICHDGHLDDAKIYCNFCAKGLNNVNGQVREMKRNCDITDYLKELNKKKIDFVVCQSCKERHSSYWLCHWDVATGDPNECAWCAVEKVEKARRREKSNN